ncbi:Rve domain containing hypothetical protein [Phytophthora palmivora]|uniref:Retroviral polymerase SH3-like domain-containing protein n=1 Tax=Phytophthora palmivora TaxID=4796 RepID=A0A2P4XLY9_9STRA|nr:Rve domain containing hypothetical protein [Phytophthora palmivora]
MPHRSEVYQRFEEYYERIKTQQHVRMKALRSDDAKEFKKLQTTCESKYGMEFDSSIKHTPEQNGVAEWMAPTLTERTRCMLVHFDLPEVMWAEAAMTATHYVDIMPSSVRGTEVPYAVWHRHTPAYEKLRTFGCAVLLYMDKVERQKMQTKAQEAVFVGFSREKRGYRLLNSKTKAFNSYTVVFYENKGGRLCADSALQPSDVTTKEYFGLDSSVGDSIEPMLNEMHEDSSDGDNCMDGGDWWTGGASDANDGSDSRTSKTDDTPHNDPPGEVIERVVQSGEVSVCTKKNTVSEECLITPICRALREYTGPKGSRPNDRPVTRSGRVSKQPMWLGDYVYIAY